MSKTKTYLLVREKQVEESIKKCEKRIEKLNSLSTAFTKKLELELEKHGMLNYELETIRECLKEVE